MRLKGDHTSAWVALIGGSLLFLFFGYLAKVFDNRNLILIGFTILIVCLVFYKWHLYKSDTTRTLTFGSVAQLGSIAWEAMRPSLIALVFSALVAFMLHSILPLIIGGLFMLIGLRTTKHKWTEFIAPCASCTMRETEKCGGLCLNCEQKRKTIIQQEAEAKHAEALRQAQERRHAENKQREQRRQEALTLDILMSLDPIHFERTVAALFRKAGYAVTETSVSGDGGIDLDLERDGKHEIVQCKRWKDAVGIEEVQRLCGCLHDKQRRSVRAWLVTTSTFTASAQKFAEGINELKTGQRPDPPTAYGKGRCRRCPSSS